MPSPDAFTANFTPETLNRFKDLCKQQGKQYTKVLERLAEVYLETGGALLDDAVASIPSPVNQSNEFPASSNINSRRSTIEDVLDRLTNIESNDQEFVSAFEMLIHRVESLEGQVTCKDLEKRIGHLEKAVQYKMGKSKK